MTELEAVGISTRQGTHAVHTLSYYHDTYGYQPFDLPNSYLADKLSLALPLYHSLSLSDQQYVVDSIHAILEAFVEEGLLDSALLPVAN
jgi:dTDP-4-amino-4,6-dideoxygalactose transaminase